MQATETRKEQGVGYVAPRETLATERKQGVYSRVYTEHDHELGWLMNYVHDLVDKLNKRWDFRSCEPRLNPGPAKPRKLHASASISFVRESDAGCEVLRSH